MPADPNETVEICFKDKWDNSVGTNPWTSFKREWQKAHVKSSVECIPGSPAEFCGVVPGNYLEVRSLGGTQVARVAGDCGRVLGLDLRRRVADRTGHHVDSV